MRVFAFEPPLIVPEVLPPEEPAPAAHPDIYVRDGRQSARLSGCPRRVGAYGLLALPGVPTPRPRYSSPLLRIKHKRALLCSSGRGPARARRRRTAFPPLRGLFGSLHPIVTHRALYCMAPAGGSNDNPRLGRVETLRAIACIRARQVRRTRLGEMIRPYKRA